MPKLIGVVTMVTLMSCDDYYENDILDHEEVAPFLQSAHQSQQQEKAATTLRRQLRTAEDELCRLRASELASRSRLRAVEGEVHRLRASESASRSRLRTAEGQLRSTRAHASDLRRQLAEQQRRPARGTMAPAPLWQMSSEDIVRWLAACRAGDCQAACPICYEEEALFIHGVCSCPNPRCRKVLCIACYEGCRRTATQLTRTCPYCREASLDL